MPRPISVKGFSENVPLALGGRTVRDAETDDRRQHRERDEDDREPPRFVVPEVEHLSPEPGAGDDGQERAHFEQAVRARELGVRHHLGDDAVLRRTEERRLRGHEEQANEQQVAAIGQQDRDRQQGDRDAHRRRPDQHAAFAEGVGDPAGVAGKEQKGEDEDRGRDRRAGVPVHCPDHVERDDHLEHVVDERPEELGRQERLEARRLQRSAVRAVSHPSSSEDTSAPAPDFHRWGRACFPQKRPFRGQASAVILGHLLGHLPGRGLSPLCGKQARPRSARAIFCPCAHRRRLPLTSRGLEPPWSSPCWWWRSRWVWPSRSPSFANGRSTPATRPRPIIRRWPT